MSVVIPTHALRPPIHGGVKGPHGSWLWPLPRLDGSAPRILQLGGAPSDAVTIGYPERSSSPALVPVFAAQDGVVTHAARADDGSTISIDHAGGWSTHYFELQHLLTRSIARCSHRRKERVRAGDIIGHACRSRLRIRFGLSALTNTDRIQPDLASWMPAWSTLPWFVEPRVCRDAHAGQTTATCPAHSRREAQEPCRELLRTHVPLEDRP